MGRVFWQGRVAVWALLWMAGMASGQTALPAPSAVAAELAHHKASSDTVHMAARIIASADAQGLPFAIVDKKNATLFVFDAGGAMKGVSSVLLGAAVGDKYFANLNQQDLSRLPAGQRTTPAGRFVSEPGRNANGEAIVWLDYDSALAIHRLRPGPSRERRAQRLASATPADNRISLGCVVTPVAFYESVVAPVLGASRAVVYVLPDGPFNADWLQAQ